MRRNMRGFSLALDIAKVLYLLCTFFCDTIINVLSSNDLWAVEQS